MRLVGPEEPVNVIDAPLVCDTVAHLPAFEVMHDWVKRFALMADPTRLTLLLCIRRAGEICVTDLAAAAQVRDTTVSQALRLLRVHEVVEPRRAGRVVYYRLVDDRIREVLDLLDGPPVGHAHASSTR
ncbi:MAG: ArsR/SmtB family transcription factor [Pseudonocardia sp.]